jgi:hypothetical protein
MMMMAVVYYCNSLCHIRYCEAEVESEPKQNVFTA